MNYQEAMRHALDGHAIVRSSWDRPGASIKILGSGQLNWITDSQVLPWRASAECEAAQDWILADDIYLRAHQARRAAVESLTSAKAIRIKSVWALC